MEAIVVDDVEVVIAAVGINNAELESCYNILFFFFNNGYSTYLHTE